MDDLKLWSRREIGRMQLDLERLFEDFTADLGLPCCTNISVVSSEQGFVLRTVLPGIRPEDLRITVDEHRVQVQAVIQVDEQGRGVRRTMRRSVSLPAPVDPERAEAQYADGVLEIRLPRRFPRQPRILAIRVGRSEP
jgi:HSP20 family protein